MSTPNNDTEQPSPRALASLGRALAFILSLASEETADQESAFTTTLRQSASDDE